MEYSTSNTPVNDLLKQASLLANQGKLLQSVNILQQILSTDPNNFTALHGTGVLLGQMGRYEEALKFLSSAVAAQPDSFAAHYNRANTFQILKRHNDALLDYDKVLTLKPDFAEAYNNRGNTLNDLHRYDEALTSFDKALELIPNSAEVNYNIGNTYKSMYRYEDALECFEKVISLNPDYPYIYGIRLLTQMHIGVWTDFEHRTNETIKRVDRGMLAAEPFSLLATPASVNVLQKCASLHVADKYPSAPQTRWPGKLHDHPRIRIGYFSADFHNHATSVLMAELFENHDRANFEIFAFSFGPTRNDDMRARLMKAFDRFLDVSEQSHQSIAALARKMEIDIAVDLKGFTTDARPEIFALRPAPIQVSYLGFPGTMGAPFMDYIIADPVVIPKEHSEFYTEKIVYLPHTYQVNDSQRRIANSTPTRSALGLPETGFVFCCFNNNFKITPDVFSIWTRLLSKVAGSVLWLLEGNTTIQRNLRREAQKREIDPERLVFAPRIDLAEHLARQRQADLFLDTFYYNAHTTTSDALWTGLPVVTCLGDTFAARVAASLLQAVGLPELVTHNHEEYESMALELATNPDTLTTVKRKLDHNRTAHPLFNIDLFTRHIEGAYAAMWRRHQQDLAPDHIFIDP